jgi:hypothetical protein
MVKAKKAKFDQELSREANVVRTTYIKNPLFGHLTKQISFKSLRLLNAQYLIAESVLMRKQPATECTESFCRQYGLLCAHQMIPMLEPTQVEGTHQQGIIKAKVLMQLYNVDQHWCLRRDLVCIIFPGAELLT